MLTAGACAPSTDQPEAPGRGEGVYRANEDLEMAGSPPSALITGDSEPLDVIATDWAALGGRATDPTTPVRWTRRGRADSPLDVSISTPQLPIRVVTYTYESVGRDGIPPEQDGREERCTSDRSTEGWFYFRAASGRVIVTTPPLSGGIHVVMQAAWITATPMEDVQLSYAWQVGLP